MTTIPGNKGATYTFASQPRAVQSGAKSKFRDPATHLQSTKKPLGNMMYDPRIVRGNTFRKQVIPASMQPDPLEMRRQQEMARRKAAMQKRVQKARPRTPEAVDGRKHIDVQTELYLEELTDRVEEQDVQTQTDPFLDRPPTPLFIPPKTGVDVATQILEGELFDFDLEVKPILEVLVGKTMEQALMEVMEEEELEALRQHQRDFEDLRNAELAEVQRQEESARRREAEKEARIHEQRQALMEQKETAQKIAARAFAQSYLSELVPSVFTSLSDGGFFYDRQEREVETQFIPWLMDAVDTRLQKSSIATRLIDEIIRAVVAKRSRAIPEPAPAPSHTDSAAAPGDSGDDGDDDDNDGDGDADADAQGKDNDDAGDAGDSADVAADAEAEAGEAEAGDGDAAEAEGEAGDGGSAEGTDEEGAADGVGAGDSNADDDAGEGDEEGSAEDDSNNDDGEEALDEDEDQDEDAATE